MLKKKLIGILLILVLFLITSPLGGYAQPGGPECPDGEYLPPGEKAPDGCIPTPLDGGVLFLIAVGVAFGIKKLKDNNHNIA